MVSCLRRYIVFTCCIERLGLFCTIPHLESYLSTWSSFYYKAHRGIFSLFKYWRCSYYLGYFWCIYSYSKLIRVYGYIITKICNIRSIFYSKFTTINYIRRINSKVLRKSCFCIIAIDLSSSPIRKSVEFPIGRSIGFVLQFISKFITTSIICYSTCYYRCLCCYGKSIIATYRFICIRCSSDSNHVARSKHIKFKYIRITFSSTAY